MKIGLVGGEIHQQLHAGASRPAPLLPLSRVSRQHLANIYTSTGIYSFCLVFHYVVLLRKRIQEILCRTLISLDGEVPHLVLVSVK